MYNSIRIVIACLGLIALLSCTSMHERSASPASSDTTSVETSNVGTLLSEDEIKLRTGPGDPVAGRSKAELCNGCHGEDGNSPDSAIPKLAGQYGMYITKQVRNYHTGMLTNPMMSSMAATVSDEDLDDISAYYASQPMMKGDVSSDNKVGRKLFENDDMSRMMVRCSSCHGNTGKGLTSENPVYPVIGGQHKDYLLAQLLNFRKGARNNSPGGMMNTIVQHLTDAELEALADYASGL
jgi:cytochrome c553